MKRKIINLLLAILFSLTFFITSLTIILFNDNYIKYILKKNNYYEITYKTIKKDIKDNSITEKKVKEDINKYIKSKYSNIYYKYSNEEYRDKYNYYIKFSNIFHNIDVPLIINSIYLINIILIVITGTLLLKTKGIHNIDIIIIFNFIISIGIFGLIYLFINSNSEIINIIINDYNHYYLAISIIIFLLMIFNKLKTRLKN